MNTKNQYIQPDTKVYRITPFKLLDTQSLPERDNEPISEGELDAMILFVIGLEDAGKLVRSVMHDESADWHTEMGISAIKEVGNIMIGSYVASMESLTGKKFRYTPPQLCVDMAGAILDIPCIHISKVRDAVLLVDSKFTDGEKELGGYVMVFSDEHSYDRLLRDLGVGVD